MEYAGNTIPLIAENKKPNMMKCSSGEFRYKTRQRTISSEYSASSSAYYVSINKTIKTDAEK